MKIKLNEAYLNRVIKEIVEDVINENIKILYHCSDEMPRTRMGIWLSDEPDENYGSIVYEYEVDLSKLKLADFNTVLNYIKKYDIHDFNDAMRDGYLGLADNINDLLDDEDMSDEEKYQYIHDSDWSEIMAHPWYYYFFLYLKEDGYDGYVFQYQNEEIYYYYIFNENNVKRIK